MGKGNNSTSSTEVASQEQQSRAVAVPKDEYIKHPLKRSWTMWYYQPKKDVSWEMNLHVVATFATIEDFWALYNHIEVVSRLKTGADYSLFREGIKPMWEDPANKNGGRWTITTEKYQRTSALDKIWEELLMMVVGECNDEDLHEDINGVVANLRGRGDRLNLWTASSDNPDLTMKVGRCMKRSLNVPSNQSIEFQLHDESKSRKSSSVKVLYYV